MESAAQALHRLHHQARSALTSADLALHGLKKAGLDERNQARLDLLKRSLTRIAELLTEMEPALPPTERAKTE